jgi:DivIVA domain-containing protein
MAASLSRPDPASPASVAEAGFSTSRRGYNTDEVRAFLTSVAAEMRRLKEHERQLEAELRAALASAPARAELDDETVANLLGEETLRVLQTARESAQQIKIRAEETASRSMREAHDDANRLRQEAEIEAARRRHDAQSEAEAEVAVAKQQGREMVNEARAYRERVLADLERRTKLARQHIEELAHGRDRLLQVFERARLVAVDVTSDLQSFAGPEEFVSFAPTTGPVPLMVPASALGGDRSPDDTGPVAGSDDTTAALTIDDSDDSDDSDGTDGTDDTDGSERAMAEMADEPIEVVAMVEASETGEAVETAATAETAETDVAAETDSPDEPTAAKPRDTNVVSLFRDRAAGDEPPEAPAVEDPERPDVDGIFARLRSDVVEEQPVADVATDAVADTAVEAPVAEPDVEPVVEQTPFTRRDEALVPLILTAARKLKRVLADEQNGVLDTLRRREPVTGLDAIAPELDVHVATYVSALVDELAAAAAAGAGELGAKDTKTLRRTLDKAGALESARTLVRTDLVTPLRDRLERAIADGPGDNDDITRRVRAVYREWKTQHIDDQLDDVFRYAFGGGLAVTIEPGTPLAWTIDPAQPACADCEDNSLAGSVASGESFPTGHTSAPAHPGCRCLTLPGSQ